MNDGTLTINTTESDVLETLVEDALPLSTTGNVRFYDSSATSFHIPQAQFAGTGSPKGVFTFNILDDATAPSVPGDVDWSYTIDNALVQYLGVGDTLVETFTVTVLDDEGNSITQDVTITIQGSNDGPTFVDENQSASLDEIADTTGGEGVLEVFGALVFEDLDVSQDNTHIVSTALTTVGGTGPSEGRPSNTALEGFFTAVRDNAGTLNNTGKAAWEFNAADTAFDYLDSGETLVLTYTVSVDDGLAPAVTRTVTVTITGANDVASIDVTNPTAQDESNASAIISFNIADHVSIADPDISDVANYYLENSGELESADGPTPPTGTLEDLLDFTLATGAVSYDRADFNYLAAGQSVTYTIRFNALSGNDDPVLRHLVITINGQQDAPVVILVDMAETIDEAVTGPQDVTGTGSLTIEDADASETVSIQAWNDATVSWNGGDLAADHPAIYNALKGSGALSINDNDAATNVGDIAWAYNAGSLDLNFLDSDESITVTYTVNVTDGTAVLPQTITITINGANDVASGTPTATLDPGLEDQPYIVSAEDLLQGFSDVDGDSLSVAGLASSSGSVADNGNGTFTITPAANYNGPVTLTYGVYDGTDTLAGQTRSFTLGAAPDTDIVNNNATLNDDSLTAPGGNLLVGSGIPGTNFVVATDAIDAPGVEIGLRADMRFAGTAPREAVDSNVFYVSAGPALGTANNATVPTGSQPDPSYDDTWARWNYTFSINADTDDVNGGTLADFHYTFKVSNISGETPVVLGSGTLEAALTAQFGAVAAANFLANNSIFQDSLNLESFFPTTFDPSAPGRYRVEIIATDKGNNSSILANSIDIIVNHAPVALADALSATEDQTVTYTAAQLLDNDSDADGNTLTIKEVGNAVGGTVTLNEDGTVTFVPTLNFNGPASFTYIATDSKPIDADSNSVTVSINVASVNDAPALVGLLAVPNDYTEPVSGNITLNSGNVRSGNFVVNDVDAGAVLEIKDANNNGLDAADITAIRQAATFQWFDADGTTLHAESTGTTAGATFPYPTDAATDGSDGPLAATFNTVLPTAQRAALLNAFDITSATQVGNDLTIAWTFDNNVASGSGVGRITIDSDATGTLPTTVATINVNFLGVGEKLIVTFPIKVTDQFGAETTVNLPVTFVGTNDAIVVGTMAITDLGESATTQVDNPVTPTVESDVATPYIQTSGSFTFAETDSTDSAAAIVSVVRQTLGFGGGASTSAAQHPAAVTAWLANNPTAIASAFKATVNTTPDTNDGTIGWDFAIPAGILDYLREGQTVSVTYRVTLTDGTANSTRDVTIRITGTNDQPEIISVTGNNSTVAEVAGASATQDLAAVTGTIVFRDKDGAAGTNLDDAITVSVVGDAAASLAVGTTAVDGFTLPMGAASLVASGALTFTISSFTATGGNQTINWTYDPAAADLDFLGQGETLTLTYTVQLQDNSGILASNTTTQTLTFTITGTNDGPMISSTVINPGPVDEDASATAQDISAAGSISVTDLDRADTLTASATADGTVTYSGGNLNLPDGLEAALKAQANLVFALTATSSSGVAQSMGFTYSAADLNLDFLRAGETIIIAYPVKVNDGHEDSATQTVTITIQGSDDAPTIGIASSTSGVVEDGGVANATVGTASVEGNAAGEAGANWTDLDRTEDATIVITEGSFDEEAQDALDFSGGEGDEAEIQGNYGTLFLKENGEYRYELDNALAQALDTTDTAVQEVFNYTITSDGGGAALSTITISIAGSNDAPVLEGFVDPASVAEDTNASAQAVSVTGSIDVTDVDANDTLTASPGTAVVKLNGADAPVGLVPAALLSGLSFATTPSSSSGTEQTINWTYAPVAADLDFLKLGDTLTISFPVKVNDGTVDSNVQNIVITITGSNDGPVATADTGTVAESGTLTVTDAAFGVLANDTDADRGETATLTVTPLANVAGTNGGSFTINADGTYSFSAGSAFEYLAALESTTTSVTYTVTDVNGVSDTETLTVTVTGTNDDPVVTVATGTGGTFTEPANFTGDSPLPGGTGSQPVPAIEGSFVIADADDTGSSTVTKGWQNIPFTINGSGATLSTAQQAELLAALSIPADLGGGNDGTVNWSFQIANSKIDFLRNGQTLTLNFAITVNDNAGGAVSRPISIVINGTNDPILANGTPDTAGEITEANVGPLADTGTIGFTDADFTNHLALVNRDSGSFTGGTFTASVTDSALTDGTGVVTWNYSVTPGQLDYLYAEAVVTETFRVRILDPNGGELEQFITITITGTNDDPVISSEAQAAGVTEIVDESGSNTEIGTSGILDFSDVDLTANVEEHTASVESVSVGGDATGLTLDDAALKALMDLTVTATSATTGLGGKVDWSFAAEDLNFDYLAEGEELTLTYNIRVTDQRGGFDDQTVTITVTGTNDAPKFSLGSGDSDSAPIEETNGALTADGTLTITDKDLTDVVTADVASVSINESSTGTDGGIGLEALEAMFTLDAHMDLTGAAGTGTITWIFNSGSQFFNHLADGETLVLDYVISASDDNVPPETVEKTVSITITGSNDGPVLSGGGTSTQAMDEVASGNTVIDAAGSFAATDVDLSDVVSITEGTTTVAWSNVAGTIPPAVLAALTAPGAFVVSDGDETADNAATADWTYDADVDLNFLAEDETLTVTIPVTFSDGAAEITRDVVITITGTNDDPVIASTTGGVTLAATEAASGVQTVSGTGSFTITDVDATDALEASTTNAVTAWSGGNIEDLPSAAQTTIELMSSGGSLGLTQSYDPVTNTLTANWAYSAAVDLNFLDSDETLTLTYTVTTDDGKGGTVPQTVTVTIQGANDAAVITVTNPDAVIESDSSSEASQVIVAVAGQVEITDADHSDQETADSYVIGSGMISATGPSPASGALTDLVSFDNTTGRVTYDRAAFNWLDNGETVTYTVSFNAQSGDDDLSPQTLSFSINGENDAPVAVADVGSANENANGSFDVLANDTDVDKNESKTITAIELGSVTGLGMLTLAELADIANDFAIAGNQITFTPGAGLGFPGGGAEVIYDRLSAGQSATITLNYTMKDDSDVTSSSTLTLTINGADESFTGDETDNVITGSSLDDIMQGNGGDDTLTGGSGADEIDGGSGDDGIDGGSGDDLLVGGQGSDDIQGGSGANDTVVFNGSWLDYVITQTSAAGVGAYEFTNNNPESTEFGDVDNVSTVEFIKFGGISAPSFAIGLVMNDAPVAGTDTATINEDGTLTISLASLLSNDSDIDVPLGDSFTVTAVGGASTGTVLTNGGNVVFTPAANFNGSASFTYTLTDAKGATSIGTVNVTVNPVVDLTAGDDVASGDEDTVISGTVADSTTSGGSLTYAVATAPATGSLVFNSNGSFDYTPAANAHGDVTFTYTVTDAASGESATQTVTITVDPVADLTAGDDVASGDEDTVISGTVADSTTSGGSLTYAVATAPATGSLVFNSNGSFDYTPAANAHGDVTFTYTVTDAASGESATQTVTITVDPVADLTAADDVASGDEDTVISGTVADSTTSGGSLTYAVATAPATGSLVFNSNGSYDYTPAANAHGDVTFTYTVTDAASGESATQTVTITVDPVVDLTAADDVASGDEDTVISGTVADSTTSGGSLTYAVASAPASGTLVLAADGSYTFTPAANAHGDVIFTYTVTDAASGESATQTVTITVDPVADLTAADDVASGDEDTVISGTVADSTTSGGSLTYAVATAPATGSLVFNSNGSFDYTPAANFYGDVTFTYTVTDAASGESATQTVTITVDPVNDDPVGTGVSVSGNEDEAITGTVTGTDVDGDELTFALGTGPANGAVTVNGDGSFSYQGNENYHGADSFTVMVSDGAGGSDEVTVNVTVAPVNDAPVIDEAGSDLAPSGDEDTAITGTLVAADADADTLSYAIALGGAPAHGVVIFDGVGGYTYTPVGNYNGTDSFTVEVTDGNGGSDTVVVNVTVDPVNDPSVITGDITGDVQEEVDLQAYGALVNADADAGEGFFQVVAENTPGANGYGTFEVLETGAWSYNLDNGNSAVQELGEGETLTDNITVISSDGSASQVITITIMGTNDTPVINVEGSDLAPSGNEDEAITGTVTGTDVDGDELTFALGAGPANGTVTVNGDGSFSYQGNENYHGSDSFTVEVSDGAGGSDEVTVNVTVAPVNDAPVSNAPGIDDAVVDEDAPVDIIIPAGTFTDVDGDTLTYSATLSNGDPLPGTLTADPNTGRISGSLPPNFNGVLAILVIASDGTLSAQASFNLTVNPVNDDPDSIALSSTTANEFVADGTVVGQLTATDVDNASGFTYTLVDNAGGRFAVEGDQIQVANGLLLDFEQNQTHNIIVEVSDGAGGTFQETITINVNDINPENITGAQVADHLVGGAGNDTFSGRDGNDRLEGGGGNDSLSGGRHADTLIGGSGNDRYLYVDGADTITENFNEGIDTVITGISRGPLEANVEYLQLAGVGNITGVGNELANNITGNTGNNMIVGGLGTDRLIGGDGADTFKYNFTTESGIGAVRDTIYDFLVDVDKIDLSAIDAMTSVTGEDSFSFIGSAAFTAEGQVRVVQGSGGVTVVEVNTSGTTGADMQIRLLAVTAANMDGGDFIL